MRLKIILAVGLILVAVSGPAAAKFTANGLTIDGPGMPAAGVIHERRPANRLSSATLLRTDRVRTKRPASTGPAYLLKFRFGVGDANGSRTEIIRQTLYPFAAGGPVVRTPRGQMIDMSYGPARFRAGWFEVPKWILEKLEAAGLPQTAPEIELDSARTAPTRFEGQTPMVPWLVALAVALVGAIAITARRVKA